MRHQAWSQYCLVLLYRRGLGLALEVELVDNRESSIVVSLGELIGPPSKDSTRTTTLPTVESFGPVIDTTTESITIPT